RHWRALTIFTVLVAAAAIWSEKHFFPDIDVIGDEGAPVTPATPVAPDNSADGDKSREKSEDAKSADPAAQAVMSQTVTIDSRPAAVLRGEGKWADSAKILAEALSKLKTAVSKAGLPVNGKPIAAFTKTDEAGFKFEVMMPLAKAPEGKSKLADGVEIGSSPSGKALKFQHRGSYDEIDATYEAIAAYLDEKGLDTKEMIVEEYLSEFKGDDGAVDVDIYVFLK
ncbi:MAG: GyrI-like domain-containing protein, partial [Methylocystis sp.]|nr:GyrI-like domain-containing protein [Methylocystis sp.]